MSQQAPFSPLHLTTDHVPRHKKIELVRDIFGREIMNVDIEPVPATEFRADLKLRALPQLKMVTSQVHGLVTARTAAKTVDGDDDLFLTCSLAGNMICNQRGRETALESNQAFLGTNAEAMSYVHLHSRAIGLVVPRKAIGALVSNIDDRISAPLSRQKAPLGLLHGYISALATTPHALFDPALAKTAVTHVHDLIALVIGAHPDGQEMIAARGLKAAQLQAVKSYIAAHFADFDLSVSSTAMAHRMPLRYLQRLFEAEGTTFTAYVLALRLEYVYRLLNSPLQLDRTIGMIATEAGFSDIPHFNNVFKRRFGATPSDIRANIKPAH